MKPKPLSFGVLCLVMAIVPAQAEFLTNFLSLLKGPSATEGIAIPRPISGSGAERVESPAPPESLTEVELPAVGENEPVAGKALSSKSETLQSEHSIPGWDGRRLNILGIDRTDFPDILVLMQVKDHQGLPALQVDLDGFQLTEDEAPQPVFDVGPCTPARYPGEPLSLVLLVDTSGSMQKFIDRVQASIYRFTQKLRDDDQLALVGFCNQPVLITPLTSNKKKMLKGIYRLNPRGFTALYDSLYMGVENLSSCGGRKAIILLTDGKDDDGTGAQLSRTPLNNAIMAAQRSHIPVFTIGLGEEISQSTLEKIADETGGEYLFAPNGADLDDLYSEIASELGRGDEGYYRLTYRATESHKDGSDRTIIIRYEDATAIATYPAPKKLWPF